MENIIEDIRNTLRGNIDEKTAGNSQRFFKEKIKSYEVRIPVVNKISKEFFSTIKDKRKDEIFGLCEELWKSGYLEESFVACNWSYYLKNKYQPEDFYIFQAWLDKYVNNWASCDTLCNHTIGTFIEMYPEYVHELKKWTRSENRWIKRGAAVSLIIPARKGLFWEDIKEIADLLFSDTDDLVQKGYGWMLKAASEVYQDNVFEYVMERKKNMPRTALRYAIEKMPAELRAKAMEK